jgi:hypothetical protein
MKPVLQKKTEINENTQTEPDLVRSVDAAKINNTQIMKKYLLSIYIILIFLGVITGFILSGKSLPKISNNKSQNVTQTDKSIGSSDTKTFKDSAEGSIEKGGLSGEGTHKLIREGGPSQTVYLISSVVDLDSFVGKKVKVWGQTMAAQKAAWLMDVGKVEQE